MAVDTLYSALGGTSRAGIGREQWVACLQHSSVDDIELKAASASSLQDALSRASESEKALRVLQLRVSELEALTSSAEVATSTNL